MDAIKLNQNILRLNMIILDHPYVSQYLIQTIQRHQIPVIHTPSITSLQLTDFLHELLISEEEAVSRLSSQSWPKLYTNSENAIGWIAQHLSNTILPSVVSQFKNKVRFRELMADLYPAFYFREVETDQLPRLDIHDLPYPLVIKPSSGFFSLGVHHLTGAQDWQPVLQELTADTQNISQQYPVEVVDDRSFILESYLEGQEYAFDAYFDDQGEPVVLNLYKHLFSSDSDVSDRVYVTSRSLIQEHLQAFTEFLDTLAQMLELRNFPLHVEVRIDGQGQIAPIEINPSRFGGWCTTADITSYAFGFNPYAYFLEGLTPDWPDIFAKMTNQTYAIVVLDNNSGIDSEQIAAFDYEQLRANFEHPLNVRPVNYERYPLFGFVFLATDSENSKELQQILHSDLRRYIATR
ncbi:MAG: ATP-grasp domain-containing protein [Bacteroidota bacterium]